MNKLERVLKHQLNKEENVPYPDFDGMWKRMEDSGHTETAGSDTVRPAILRRSRSWSRVAGIAALSALLAAAPVYAAIHYNWDTLLRGREGIQSALDQNLGQQLGQSITKDGVTLTLHTAIVDDNRTVILYNLDVDKRADNEYWSVKGMSLKGEADNNDKENNSNTFVRWDEKNKRYNGYFESDWAPQQENSKAILLIDSLFSYQAKQLEIPKINLNTAAPQIISLGQDGLRNVEVQVFEQGEKLMLTSAISYDSPEAKQWDDPQIVPYKDGKPVRILPGSTYGKPGEKGEYTAIQYFNRSDLVEGQVVFKLDYAKREKSITEPIRFDLELSKKQMESGTTIKMLNEPLERGDNTNTIERLVVTPTQIRVSIRTKDKAFQRIPYYQYELEIGGKTLEGELYLSSKDDPLLITLHFERPADLVIGEETPIVFVGKYKVTIHEEDKTPLELTNISASKQTLIRDTGGFPVKWTYYMQGSDLLVETESEDARFGGVNQTHIGIGKDRILGKPVTTNFNGDGNNKAIDVYKNFKGTKASIYMFYYTTDDPDKETRVTLQPYSQ